MTTTQSPAAPTRTYADYSAPLWRRWLLTREMAVIALTVAVSALAARLAGVQPKAKPARSQLLQRLFQPGRKASV